MNKNIITTLLYKDLQKNKFCMKPILCWLFFIPLLWRKTRPISIKDTLTYSLDYYPSLFYVFTCDLSLQGITAWLTGQPVSEYWTALAIQIPCKKWNGSAAAVIRTTVNTNNAKEMLNGVFSNEMDSKCTGDTGLSEGLNERYGLPLQDYIGTKSFCFWGIHIQVFWAG